MKSRHRPWLVYAIAAAGLVAVAGVAAVGFALAPPPSAGPSTGPSAAPGSNGGEESPEAVPTPTPVASDDGPVAEVVDELVTDFVGTVAALTADPEADIQALSTLAADAILAELESERLELSVNEFTKTGTPEIVSVTVLESTDATATVAVCLDSSDVQIVDAAGEPVNTTGGTSPRAINLYTLELRDDVWIVTTHSFPNDPQC